MENNLPNQPTIDREKLNAYSLRIFCALVSSHDTLENSFGGELAVEALELAEDLILAQQQFSGTPGASTK